MLNNKKKKMTTKRIVLTGLALLLIFTLAGCSGGGGKKQTVETIETAETVEKIESPTTEEQKDDDILTKLLKNNAKIVRLDLTKRILAHNGQVYNSTNIEIPGSKPVPYCNAYAIIDNVVIYYSCQRGENARCELWRKDLRNEAETLILENVYISDVWIAGDRVIYAKKHYPENRETTGLFWYDLKTSKTTRLHKEMNQAVSFDNDFMYFSKNSVGDIWRVRWDGTQEELLQDVKMPKDLYKVEGDYYYCIKTDYNTYTDEISRYAINGSKPAGVYPFDCFIIDVVDGWAYFKNKTGLHKKNMANGKTVQLADFTPFENISFNLIMGITRDSIYFEVVVEGEDGCFERWYKIPLKGGAMELISESECYFD